MRCNGNKLSNNKKEQYVKGSQKCSADIFFLISMQFVCTSFQYYVHDSYLSVTLPCPIIISFPFLLFCYLTVDHNHNCNVIHIFYENFNCNHFRCTFHLFISLYFRLSVKQPGYHSNAGEVSEFEYIPHANIISSMI